MKHRSLFSLSLSLSNSLLASSGVDYSGILSPRHADLLTKRADLGDTISCQAGKNTTFLPTKQVHVQLWCCWASSALIPRCSLQFPSWNLFMLHFPFSLWPISSYLVVNGSSFRNFLWLMAQFLKLVLNGMNGGWFLMVSVVLNYRNALCIWAMLFLINVNWFVAPTWILNDILTFLSLYLGNAVSLSCWHWRCWSCKVGSPLHWFLSLYEKTTF